MANNILEKFGVSLYKKPEETKPDSVLGKYGIDLYKGAKETPTLEPPSPISGEFEPPTVEPSVAETSTTALAAEQPLAMDVIPPTISDIQPRDMEESKVKDVVDAFYLGMRNMIHQSKQYFKSTLPNTYLTDIKPGTILEQDIPYLKWTLEGRIIKGIFGKLPKGVQEKVLPGFSEEQSKQLNVARNQWRGWFREKYNKANKKQTEWIKENPQLKPRSEWSRGVIENIKDNPAIFKDPAYWAYVAAESAAFTLGVMGVTVGVTALTKNPLLGLAAGTALAMPMESQELYEELITNGANEGQAAQLAMPLGALIASVEAMSDLPILMSISAPFKKMFGRNAVKEVARLTMKEIAKRGLKTFAAAEISEVAEEVLQKAISNAAVMTVNENKELLEGIPETAVRTLMATVPFAAFGAGAEVRTGLKEQAEIPPPTVKEEITEEAVPVVEKKVEPKPTELEPAPKAQAAPEVSRDLWDKETGSFTPTNIGSSKHFNKVITPLQEAIPETERVWASGDIANFKKINEAIGHHAGGDVVLRKTLDVVAKYFGDHAYSYSGDEFYILKPKDMSADEFVGKLTEMRQEIQKLIIPELQEAGIPYDVRIGVDQHGTYSDKLVGLAKDLGYEGGVIISKKMRSTLDKLGIKDYNVLEEVGEHDIRIYEAKGGAAVEGGKAPIREGEITKKPIRDKRVVEGKAESVAKEPWEMTLSEAREKGKLKEVRTASIKTGYKKAKSLADGQTFYEETDISKVDLDFYEKGSVIKDKKTDAFYRVTKKEVTKLKKTEQQYHKDKVEEALSEGKAVPPEVLKDYPDLAKKYKPTKPEVTKKIEVTEATLTKTVKDRIEKLHEVGRTGDIKVGRLLSEVKTEDILLHAIEQAGKRGKRLGKVEEYKKGTEKYRERIAKIRANKKLLARVNKIFSDIKKISKRITKFSAPQKKAIENIINSIDIIAKHPQRKTILRLTNTRSYIEQNPDIEMPAYVMKDLERLDKKYVKDMTIDELESLYQAVMAHVHQEITKQTIRVGLEDRRTETVLKQSVTEMKAPLKVKKEIIEGQPTKFGATKHVYGLIKDTMGIRHDHYDLIIESLSGANSTMDKVLYQGVKEGKIKEMDYRHKAFDQFQKDVNFEKFSKKHKIKDLSSWLAQTVKTGRFNLTRNQRMEIYRHSLNDNNLRHLARGGINLPFSNAPYEHYRMSIEEIQTLLNDLTPAEKEFATDPVTNLFDNQYDIVNETFKKKNGYDLPKEDFYFPIEVLKTALPADVEQGSVLEELKNKWVRIGLSKGMLEQRKKSGLPLVIRGLTYSINRSVMNSAAYVGLEIPLSNASKLLYDRKFKSEMYKRYGSQTWLEIDKGLRDIAGDWQSYTTVEELALRLKNKLSTAILGISFAIPKQILSFSLYSVYIKPQYLIQGYMDFVAHSQNVMQRHKMYSPEYRERLEGGYSRDVADIFKSGARKRLYKGKTSLPEKFMGGVKLFDNLAVAPGIQGGVLQVLDEFSKGKLSPEVKKALDITEKTIPTEASERMRLAYKFGNYATQRTQPMFSAEHRSSLSRGKPFEKFLTQFTSFTNQALNLTRRTWRDSLHDPQMIPKLAKVLFLLMVVNTGGVMAIDELRDRLYGREKKPMPLWKKYGLAILDSVAGYFYFLRDLEKSVMSKVERGTWRGFDISIPVFQYGNRFADMFASGIRVFTDKAKNKKKNADEFINHALYLLLTAMGLPYETPKKIIKGGKKKTTKETRSVTIR